MSSLTGDPLPSAMRALSGVAAAVDVLVEAPTWSLTDTELLGGLDQFEMVQRRLDAARSEWLADADHRGATKATGATSTAAWLIDHTLASPGKAYAQVRVASALAERFPALRAALAEGRMSFEQAQVCVKALDALPSTLSTQAHAEAEALLVDQAGKLDARKLAITGKHLRRVTDPDAEDRLFEAERKAREKNWFAMYSDPDNGGGPVAGWLDAISQAQLRAALRPLAAPMAEAGELRDDRTSRQRNGDALVELARRACSFGDLPVERGHAPHVMVTMTLESLDERIRAAHAFLEDGTAISAHEARRLACDARIIPVLLGSQSEPLDVGRASYPVPAAIRRALIARDGGCAQPGCGRPAAWCDAHHIVPWADGGRTSLANTVLLCEPHHRLYHGGGWLIRMAADHHSEVQPPRWHKLAGRWIPSWRRRSDGNVGPPPT